MYIYIYMIYIYMIFIYQNLFWCSYILANYVKLEYGHVHRGAMKKLHDVTYVIHSMIYLYSLYQTVYCLFLLRATLP